MAIYNIEKPPINIFCEVSEKHNVFSILVEIEWCIRSTSLTIVCRLYFIELLLLGNLFRLNYGVQWSNTFCTLLL